MIANTNNPRNALLEKSPQNMRKYTHLILEDIFCDKLLKKYPEILEKECGKNHGI
jgi:hypothetical protein